MPASSPGGIEAGISQGWGRGEAFGRQPQPHAIKRLKSRDLVKNHPSHKHGGHKHLSSAGEPLLCCAEFQVEASTILGKTSQTNIWGEGERERHSLE